MKHLLETPRLLLREMDLDDLDFVAAMLAHPEVMRYWPKPYSRDEAAAWIQRQQERYAQDGHGYWLALEKTTSQPVGQVGLLEQQIDDAAETGIGYLIHRPFWQQGFATEAASACRDYALDQLSRRRVITLIRPENARSLRVALKLGMKAERHAVFAGFVHIVFSLSREASRQTATRG